MALVFHAILEPTPDSGDLVATVNEWLILNGVGPLSDSETELVGQTTGGESLSVSLRSFADESAQVREVVAYHEGPLRLRSTLTEVIDRDGTLLLAEEEILDIAGGYSELPMSSELVRSVVSKSTFNDPDFDRPTPAPSPTPIQSWFNQLPDVIAVGPAGEAILSHHLRARVTGMGFVTEEPLESVAPRVSQPISEGSVVVLDADGSTRLVLPTMVCRLDPAAAARRVHREVLGCVDRHALPERLKQAKHEIRRSGGSVDEWVNEVGRLEAEVRSLRQEADLAILEATEALSELDESRRRVRHLERSFRNEHLTEAPLDEDEPPPISSFDDIFAYADELLPNLWIRPGTRRHSVTLDQRPESMLWSQQAWYALQALNDYAKAKLEGAADGNFLSYCSNAPAGWLTYPPGRVALHESESTMSQPDLRRARTFEVPETVEPSGQILMDAHIKVTKTGTNVPRLHFHDDTNGTTKKVLVGYLGPHLPVSSS